MERPTPRHRVALAAALVVTGLLLGAVPLIGHGTSVRPAEASPATAPPVLPASRSPAVVPAASLSGSAAPATPGLSSASAGSIIRTIFPNYNATLPGNFPATVNGWQIGTPAYVPSTQELWLPNRAVSVNGIAPPPIAPAIIYNVTTNKFAGFDLSIENTSAFLYDTGDRLLYTADYGNDSVGIINPASGSWIHSSISVGSQPVALALDNATNRLYVANSGSDNITVIDCHTDIATSIPLPSGTAPHSLAVDTSSQLLIVADGSSSQLSSVRLATNLTGPSVPLLGVPGGLAFSSVGNTLGVTIPTQTRFLILNATNLATQGFLTVGPGMNPCVLNPNGTSFVIGNASGQNIDEIQSSSGAILGSTILAGAEITELSPQLGDRILAWSAAGRNLTEVNMTSLAAVDISPTLGPQPSSVAFDAQGGSVFVADAANGTVIRLSSSTGLSDGPSISVPTGALSVAVDPLVHELYSGSWNGVYEYNETTGQTVRSITTLTGGNSALLVDDHDNLLWIANRLTGLHAVHLSTLTSVYTVPLRPAFGAQTAMALVPRIGELFVINSTANFIEAVNTSTGAIVASAITAGSLPSAIAYDSADNALYVAGANVTMVDPTTGLQVGGTIPLPPHSGAATIAYDPTRQYLYIATYGGSPTRATTITVLDGSSVSASQGSQVTMPAGQLVTDIVPITLAGSESPAYSAVWLADAQSGTLSIIASPPSATLFTASPSTIDAGGTSRLLVGYQGGTGPDTIQYAGLPSGCSSSNSAALNCTPTAAGNYSLTATITDAFGYSAQISTQLIVHSGLAVRPVFSPGVSLDVGIALNASALVSGGTPSYSYLWSFGDGGTSTSPNSSHFYSTPGSYLVTLSVSDALRAITTSSTIVVVSPLPTGTVVVSPINETDVGLGLGFIARVVGGTGIGVGNWSFGDGNIASGMSASHVWTAPGNYTVAFRYVDALGESWTQSSVVRVAPALNGTFTIGSPGVPASAGSAVTFSAQPIGGTSSYNFTWSFGDGSYGYGRSVSHTYALSGTYTIHAELTDSAGARVLATLSLYVQTASTSVPPGSGPSPQNPDSQMFLGVILGAVAAAVILAVTGRSRRRTRHPPSPYVPPDETIPPR